MKLIFSLNEHSHGASQIRFSWQNKGNHIATTGSDGSVKIWDRQGELHDDIANLAGICTSLAWDAEGDLLAITTNRSNVITLFDINTATISKLDSSMGQKDFLSFAVWSKNDQVLAVGNSKGNLLLYNHKTARKVPVIGKHTKQITCGAFSKEDLLALGSDDCHITVSNLDGDTMYTVACNAEPTDIRFAEMKQSDRGSTPGSETTISSIVGNDILMLANLSDIENPINLQFQAKYGNIESYCWYGDGYILLGFQHGFLVSVSTHVSEIGQEIFSVQDHKNYMSSVAINIDFGKAVSAGDNCLKLRELNQLGEIYSMVELETEDKGLDTVAFSWDGQLLAASGMQGCLYVYLTRLPVMGDCWGTRLIVLTALTELTLHNDVANEPAVSFVAPVEPAFVAVGPLHVAVGINHTAWFYTIVNQSAQQIRDKEYLESVQSLKLNGRYAAALLEGQMRLQLHKIEDAEDGELEQDSRIFPDADKANFRITCHGFSNDFLIYGTDGGHLQYFCLEEGKYVNEYRHTCAIRAIFCETNGIRMCFIDDKRDVFLYSPVNDSLISVPHTQGVGGIKAILWDNWAGDKDAFVAYDSSFITAYSFSKDQTRESGVETVGTTKLAFGHTPMMLYNDQVTCQTQSGRISKIQLESHTIDTNLDGKTEQQLSQLLDKCIRLKRWLNGWRVCEYSKDRSKWDRLAKAAMDNLDVELAMRVYRQIGNVGMVWSLEEVMECEDRNLLAGHLAMLSEQFDLAEKLYLQSSQQIEALEMRRDLLHWDRALQLASTLAPDQIPFISKEYAQQLEFTGEYSSALNHYEKGIIEGDDANTMGHNEICEGGIARMAIRTGDLRRGVKKAAESSQRSLKKECAMILETMKQYNEAAQLYESGDFFDRAGAVCIKAKNWLKVGELLPNVRSPKIHAQYAKAMEAEKKYKQAAEAYYNAKDYDNLVRILLDHLNRPEDAVKVVRESKSIEGAKLVSKYFLRLGDHTTALQFLVISQCYDEAFRMAEEQGKMEIYAECLGLEGTKTQYEQIAEYFQRIQRPFLAGKYHYLSGNYSKALELLLAVGEDEEAIRYAIECAGKANELELTQMLTDFLIGEVDGVPKDAKYLFQLYVALKMDKEAAKTAIIIAREEQNRGHYREAQKTLFNMYKHLEKQQLKIPAEMANNLMIVHSYFIAKTQSKLGDHEKAARMLIRVAQNISRFPSHTVEILTSAVIMCSKGNLKTTAFNFAVQLMKAEYRKNINEKFKKKIEAIVRKPDKTQDTDENKSPCPHCNTMLANTELTCPTCKSLLPYCIVTGRHVVKDDFTICPHCHFPALYSEFKKLTVQSSDASCPMCHQNVGGQNAERIVDPTPYLSPDIGGTVAAPSDTG